MKDFLAKWLPFVPRHYRGVYSVGGERLTYDWWMIGDKVIRFHSERV